MLETNAKDAIQVGYYGWLFVSALAGLFVAVGVNLQLLRTTVRRVDRLEAKQDKMAVLIERVDNIKADLKEIKDYIYEHRISEPKPRKSS